MAKAPATLIYIRATHGLLHDTDSASKYLNEFHQIKLSRKRLSDLRAKGIGPVCLKQGRFVKYPQSCLDDYAAIVNGGELKRSFKREKGKVARAVAHADGGVA